MKYIARFLGGLDYIQNGRLFETDSKGRQVAKGSFGKGHFGGEQGFVPNWRKKGFIVDLPQSDIDAAIKELQLIHNEEYLNTADGKNPTDPAWSNIAMKIYAPFTGKIFDTDNKVDNLWLAILRNDPEVHFLDSTPPASMSSIRWTIEAMKENRSYDDNINDPSSARLEFMVLISETSVDDKIEALLTFKDYSKEFLSKQTNKELSKHLFNLFEENTPNKFGKTVLFTLDQIVNRTEINYSIDKIFSNALDAAKISITGETFVFGDVILGNSMSEAKEFLGKPENMEVLKKIEHTIA